MKVLIVKLSSIGDILQALQAVRMVKLTFPQVSFSWLVEERYRDLLQEIDWIDEVISVDTYHLRKNLISLKTFKELKKLRKFEFSAIFDLQGNIKSSLFVWFIRSFEKVGFGFKTIHEKIALFPLTIRQDIDLQSSIIQQYFSILQAYPLFSTCQFSSQVVRLAKEQPMQSEKKGYFITIGSNWENKKLSTIDWIKIIQFIELKTGEICYLPFSNEKEENEVEEIIAKCPNAKKHPKQSLLQLQKSFSLSKGVVGIDSSLIHLASLADVPTFSIFGASSAKVFQPLNGCSFQGSCPENMVFIKRCPKLRSCLHGLCMKAINIEKILHEIEQNFLREPRIR